MSVFAGLTFLLDALSRTIMSPTLSRNKDGICPKKRNYSYEGKKLPVKMLDRCNFWAVLSFGVIEAKLIGW